jgi:hypothetical protein
MSLLSGFIVGTTCTVWREKHRPPGLRTRDEFERLVLDRTPEEVLTLLGPPVKILGVENTRPLSQSWYYANRTYDPVEGPDPRTVILFLRSGRLGTVLRSYKVHYID